MDACGSPIGGQKKACIKGGNVYNKYIDVRAKKSPCPANGVGFEGLQTHHQMVWPWKLQSSHLDSSSIFQKVLSHSPVSSFFSLIQSATCIMRRGMSQSLQRDSTVSSSSRGRDVLLKSGPKRP